MKNETIQQKTDDNIYRLYIEPTSRCNLNCTMCFRHQWFNESIKDMDIDLFYRLIDNLPKNIDTIFFGGMGEPLFHKHIIEMVHLASKKAKHVELITNGTLLNERISEELLEAGLSKLWISLDSFEQTAYEDIRKDSDYRRIMNNLATFNQKRVAAFLGASERFDHEIKQCQLGIAFVAMKSNIEELQKFPDFARQNRIDEINISNVIPTDPETTNEILYGRLIYSDLMTNQNQTNINMSFPLMDFGDKHAGKTLLSMLASKALNLSLGTNPVTRDVNSCRFVEEGMVFIKHDGNVIPCMALLHNSVMYLDNKKRIIHSHAFGNIQNQTLDEIWNGEEYSAFRRRVRNFEFSPCVRCGQCEMSDDNVEDCFGNPKPTCGACLWAEGIFSCP